MTLSALINYYRLTCFAFLVSSGAGRNFSPRIKAVAGNLDSSDISIYQTTITDIDTKSDFLAVKNGKPSSVVMAFSMVNDPLPPGRYDVIPFFIPYYKDTHEDFIKKAFPDYDIPSLDYLDIPMKRKGGTFEVTQ